MCPWARKRHKGIGGHRLLARSPAAARLEQEHDDPTWPQKHQILGHSGMWQTLTKDTGTAIGMKQSWNISCQD